MGALISVCIPTFHRPVLLKLAIESCFAQDFRPLEILIGDDSADDACERVARSMILPDGITLHYHRNRPSAGQAANVNGLFDRATGERLLLLHDDDVLYPHGIDRLAHGWVQSPGATCVYGKQAIIDPAGDELPENTAAWNERYFRLTPYAGPQTSPVVAALWQQVPNNCYLVESDLARRVRYRSERDAGQCVDAEFVIRLAQHAASGSFVLVDAMISQYRLTPASIARSKTLNRREDLLFDVAQNVLGDAAVEDAKATLLGRIGVGAALDAARAGRRGAALRIIFSRYYGRPLLSRWTAYRLLCTAAPSFGPHVKRWVDGAEHFASDRPVERYGAPHKRTRKTMSQN